MKRILIEDTNRAMQYGLWKDAVVPMVTVGRVFDITHLVRLSKKTGMKLNMLMCYCLGMAFRDIPEFFQIVDKDCFMVFDSAAVQVIVQTQAGIRFCDIPFDEDIRQFERLYQTRTRQVMEQCEHLLCSDSTILATSAVIQTPLDALCNQYCGFNFPFLCWGQYRKNYWGRCRVQLFLQFHHVQMDGSHIAAFFNNFQKMASGLKVGK